MDVTESQARREVELARRLLREREEDHAREVEGIRDSYRGQIDELEQAQRDNVKNVKKEAETAVAETRDHFDGEVQRVTDSYEKTLARERREGYDKFGRVTGEHARERDRDRALKTRQFNDLLDSNSHDVNTERHDREGRITGLRDKFENDRMTLKNHFDRKVAEQSEAAAAALAKTAGDARDKIDANIRQTSRDIAHEKSGAELRYKKLAQEGLAEREALKQGLGLREQELTNEKSNLASRNARSDAKAFGDYRERTNNSIQQLSSDNNFLNELKDRDYTNRLAKQERDHQSQQQDIKAQFQKAENDLRHQNIAEHDRNALKEGLNEHRHKQDVYLNVQAQRENDKIARDNMRSRYDQRARDLEETNQQRMQDFSASTQRRMSEQDMRSANDRTHLEMEKTRELTEEGLQHDQARHNLVRAYENRQNALDELRHRQLDDQKRSHERTLDRVRGDADKSVFENRRETQARLYGAHEELRNRTTEYEARHVDAVMQADEINHERARRLTAAYSRALVATKENYDEATSSLKYDGMIQMSKVRGDAEHERRMQLYDLQGKNRLMANTFEARLNQVKDDHEAEVTKMKVDNDKIMRDTLRKARDTLDTERTNHNRELDAKDRQMKEKLKLQEEAFKDQIEKLKRTNELALKKS